MMGSNRLDWGSGQRFSMRRWDSLNPDTIPSILLQGLLTLFALSLGLFALTRLVPGGPCAVYYSDRYFLSAAQHATCSARFGLGQPIVTQYLLTIGGYLRGDLGFSNTGHSIWSRIANQFPDTVLLLGGAIILQTMLALTIGWYAARHEGGRVDRVVLAMTEGVGWVPPIWLAYLLVVVLVAGLRWLPAGAGDIRLPVFWSGQWFLALPRRPGLLLGDQVRHLIIPLTATVLPGAAVSIRVVRGAVVDALRHPAVLTGRASGVQSFALVVRLAFLGLLESAGPMLAALLGSASVAGYVVVWRGDATLFWDVAYFNDWGVLITLLLLGTLAVFLVSFGARLLRVRLDPRLRGSQPLLPVAPRPSFVLDLWWIVPVPSGRAAPITRRGALPLLLIGLCVVAIMAVLATFAPFIAPGGSPTSSSFLTTGTMSAPPHVAMPGSAAWPLLLGTDGTGRPVLNWIVYGARFSLLVGALGALGAVGLGCLLGMLSTMSRPVEVIVAWLVRIIAMVPPLPLLAVLIAFLASARPLVVILLFAAVAWPATAATIRTHFPVALHTGPAVAAHVLGVTLPWILVRHVHPALVRPLLRLLTLTMGGILLTQTALDALLSTPGTLLSTRSAASWGTAFGAGFPQVADWWLPLAAGLAVYLTVLALGLIERGLASWHIRPQPHVATRRVSAVPPSAGWPLDADMLSERGLAPLLRQSIPYRPERSNGADLDRPGQ